MTILAKTSEDRLIEINNESGTITALNPNERMYVEQGYALPQGMTWNQVHDARQEHNLREIDVPLALAGCIAWGVPFSWDGKYLQHL